MFTTLEREEEEGNIDVRDKHRSVVSYKRPNRGLNPQARYVS